MDDIKKRTGGGRNDDGFVVQPLEEEDEEREIEEPAIKSPDEKVKVRFDKFVELVATHDFEKILEKSAGEEIIVGTNLLTDLANSHSGAGDRRMTFVFVVGLMIGIAVTYLLVTR